MKIARLPLAIVAAVIATAVGIMLTGAGLTLPNVGFGVVFGLVVFFVVMSLPRKP